MNKKEWQKLHDLTDDEMERVDYIKKLFNGKIVEVRDMTIDDE